MSRRHQCHRRKSPLSSGIGVDDDGTVVSYPVEASTTSAASAALVTLCVGYTYPLAAYLNFCLGGVGYPRCPLDGTVEAEEEAEAAAALVSSYLEKKFRLNSEKRGEGEE